MNIQAGHLRNASISTPSEQHRLEPGEETALALVKQTEEQDESRLALVERAGSALLLFRRRASLTRQDLSPPPGRFPRAVKIRPCNLLSCQAFLSHQPQKRLLHVHLNDLRKLRGKQPLHCVTDEPLACLNQRAQPREVDVTVGPEPALVEVGHVVECVVPAAMGVARVIGDLSQLPEYRHVDRRSECRLELLDCGDPLPAQQGHEAVRMELSRPHSVRPPASIRKSNITATRQPHGQSAPPLPLLSRIYWTSMAATNERGVGSVSGVMLDVVFCGELLLLRQS